MRNSDRWTKMAAYVRQETPPSPCPIVWDHIAEMCVKYGIDPAVVLVERPE